MALLTAGCGGGPRGTRSEDGPVHDGPIVLVTVGGLGAGAVDARLTPALHALAEEADWAGRAVAPSAFALPSLATLATGLSPWDHGTIEVGRAALAPELRTLAEALAEVGYRTAAYVSGPWIDGPGWPQGFGVHRRLGGGGRAAGHLASLGTDRQFLWIHLSDPEPTWERRLALLPRLGELPPRADGTPLAATLPRQVTARELEVYRDPSVPLPAQRRRVYETMYRLAVAHADDRLGALLAALRESGAWDDTLLVVTAPAGEALGAIGRERAGDLGGELEDGTSGGITAGRARAPAAGPAGGLSRALLEVPLLIKLPRSLRGAAAGLPAAQDPGGEGRPVALARVWATLVGAAGAPVPPAVAPSLLRTAPGGILSELYLGNGANAYSLVESDGGTTWQLVRRMRFADPEPGYHRARLATYQNHGAPADVDPARLFGRLTAAFDRVPPLAGRGAGEPVGIGEAGGGGEAGGAGEEAERQPGGESAAELVLLRWRPDGGSEPVDDPRRAAAMAQRLERRWRAFTGCDAPPGIESARRARERRAAEAAPAAAP